MTSAADPDVEEAAVEVLAPVAEVAIAVARRDAADPTAPVPPRRLHPYLRFARIPTAALSAAVAAMEADDAFRARVAEVCTTDDDLTEGQRAWLLRPQGWDAAFGAERDARVAAIVARREQHAVESSALRIEELERALAERVARIDELEAEASRLRAEVAAVSEVFEARTAELTAMRERLEAAEGERSRAVRELKATEARDAGRVERLRAVEAELEAALEARVPVAAASEPAAPVAPAGVDPREVADVVAGLRSLVDHLDALATPEPGRKSVAGHRDPAEFGGSVSGSRRRRPIRLGRGVFEGTPEAVRALFSTPGVLVLVDGWNVSMLGWPELDGQLQRRRLTDALSGLGATTGAEIHVVFDGVDEGSGPVAHGAARVRVQFTPSGVEADDRLLELADAVPIARPLIVVSNDRRVREGAMERGANVVGSTELVALIGTR